MLPESAAFQVLDFYLKNKEVFELYETDRSEQFYTEDYHRTLLRCEYNLAMRETSARYWVSEKENPQEIIGTFSFHNIRYQYYQSAELGYKFDSCIWRKGYAKESIGRGLQAIFEEMRLHRIEALVQPENEASIQLLLSLGFALEGISRQNVKLHGRWQDHAVYSLLESDYHYSSK